MNRRPLDFRSFDEVRDDVARLAAGPYVRLGKWDLGTTCDHLTKAFAVGLDNLPLQLPWFIKLLAPLAGPAIFRRTLNRRSMPRGVRAPAEFAPAENCPCEQAVARLDDVTRRAEVFGGPMPRHPFFGEITVEQWRDLMLIHCAHHLSFLVPGDGNKEPHPQ